ncbi:ubiquitin related modifier 1 [Geosmithia morbida]|uniref:Ubiquitin related modifier 1 n=1 Tax=Geosmithia morbida TaxID=1094350 RepID=A0A9P4YP27_9HYPO|nr:ubiquitin related modifier 1 [Geosmithia morbida]KAF4120516.1 ubiquitin related modifier 1 [Geosmithia morbida]
MMAAVELTVGSHKATLDGGLEMLFSDQRRHDLHIPAKDGSGSPTTVGYLIDHLCDHQYCSMSSPPLCMWM